MSKVVIIGIILIFTVALGCVSVGLVQIHSKIDKEGITHFKIDWLSSLLPLMLITMSIWIISVLWPIRYYRIAMIEQIQQAKECADERYEYCPHCGEKLKYNQKFPWSDETIQHSIEISNNENQSKILKWLCDDGRGSIIDTE